MTEDLRLFVHCVTEGSFSAAARATGVAQAVATRRIQRLEGAVGTPVLHRTTRSLRLTEAGERLLGAARTILAELSAFERGTAVSRETASGEVRVSAPVLLGQSVGGTLASELARRHPDLRLVLSLSNARVDLVRDNVDVALRVGALPSTTLLAARIATARIGAYAHPNRAPKVRHPSELLASPWVGHAVDAVMRGHGPNGERWTGRVAFAFVCDDRIVLREAVAAGIGFALLPTFLGDAEPALRRIVPDWHFGTVPVHGVWLREARHDPRIRAVVDVMTTWGKKARW